MKKTFLTLVAVGFGVSVAFAQTTVTEPVQEENQQITEQPTDQIYSQEEGRKRVEMYELPQEVQDAFKNGQYNQWEVLSIYEVSPEAADEPAAAEGAEVSGILYEFEVASATEEADGIETTEEGMEGLETEKVSERQPDMVLFFDQQGQLVKEEAPEEEQIEQE